MADIQEREIDEKTKLDVENFWAEYKSGLGQRQPSEEGEILDSPVEATSNCADWSVSNNDTTTGGTAVSDTADLPPPVQNKCALDGNIHPDRLLLLNYSGTASPSGAGQVSDQNNDDSMQTKPGPAIGSAPEQAHNSATLNQPTPSLPISYTDINLLASMNPLPEDRKRAIASAAVRIKREKSTSFSSSTSTTHRRGGGGGGSKKRHRNKNNSSPGPPPHRRRKLERAAKPICVPCLIDRPNQPCDHSNECFNCRRGSSFGNSGGRNPRQVCYYEACLDGTGCADEACAKLHPDQHDANRVWKISEPAAERNDQVVVVVRHKPPPFWGMWRADWFPASPDSPGEEGVKVEEVDYDDY